MAEAKTGNNGTRSEPVALNSWKEIARFLKADVRTCQRWERSLGFPVHRLGNSLRSRVIAYPAEIEEWRKNTLQSNDRPVNGETVRNGNGLRAAINGNNARPKFKPKHLLVFLVPVLAMTAAFLLEPYFDRNPADFRIEGPKLIILNKHGRELWVFDTKLPHLNDEAFYRIAFPEKTVTIVEKDPTKKKDAAESTVFPRIFIRDIDLDGRNEVLFRPNSIDDLNSGKLFLFDSRGKEKWIFDTNQEIQVGGRQYPPDFAINILDLKDIDGNGRPEILLAAHCHSRAPTRFVVLDSEKNILGDYWNYGQIIDFEIIDRDRDNRPEIIITGTNNEYGQAFLAVLDPADMKGTSPQSPVYQFREMETGTARYYLRFPMTPVDRINEPRGFLNRIQLMENGYFVAATKREYVWYYFDRDMNLSQVAITDVYAEAFESAVRKNLLAPPLDRLALAKELAAGVLYYDGESKTWVNHRAMANPWPVK